MFSVNHTMNSEVVWLLEHSFLPIAMYDTDNPYVQFYAIDVSININMHTYLHTHNIAMYIYVVTYILAIRI